MIYMYVFKNVKCTYNTCIKDPQAWGWYARLSIPVSGAALFVDAAANWISTLQRA